MSTQHGTDRHRGVLSEFITRVGLKHEKPYYMFPPVFHPVVLGANQRTIEQAMPPNVEANYKLCCNFNWQGFAS